MKTRLAKKEYARGLGISLKRTFDLGDCTLHGHDFYEIDIITGGKAEAITNGVTEPAGRGAVFFLTPEDFHEYKTSESLDILNIQFFGDDVSSTLLRSMTDAESPALYLSDGDFGTVCAIFDVMERVGESDCMAVDILPRMLESLLLVLHRSLNIPLNADKGARADMQAALVYIQEHFKENPPLSSVAALLSLNERYFCTRFKEYTGKTYKEYLRQTKLRYARKLILSTDISMTEICERCGYATQSHFNREFRSFYGLAPRELKKGL